MKMREVIEAGRKASPLINEKLSSVREMVSEYEQLLSDLSVVQSEAGRKSMIEQCLQGLSRISDAVESVEAPWSRFDGTLRGYVRKFKSKKDVVRDAPGQTFMFQDSDDKGLSDAQTA